MTGRNWGEAIIDGSTLVFNVAGKPALRIPLTDVGQVCSTCLLCTLSLLLDHKSRYHLRDFLYGAERLYAM